MTTQPQKTARLQTPTILATAVRQTDCNPTPKTTVGRVRTKVNWAMRVIPIVIAPLPILVADGLEKKRALCRVSAIRDAKTRI
jgi:hypothetical protein